MIELLNSFKRYLMNTIPKMVFKDKNEANKYETMTSRKLGDIYCSASLGMDTLVTYETIHDISLMKVGITDIKEINYYIENKMEIPKKYVKQVIESERAIFLSNFEEENEYYRMLMGLPPLGEDYIFLNYDLMEAYGFKETARDIDYERRTPLHLLPRNVLEAMDNDDILEELQKNYPESKYISYLGTRRIDLALARMAGHYELLYVPKVDNVVRFYRDFSFHYDEAREYFLSTVYNFAYSSKYEYYDGMIGFMILYMAIQRMIGTTFKVMVDRDFYDLATCRLFLESYHIPFEKLFSLNQQKMIIKNLNLLLMNKHTPQVLYDVLDLLGFETIDITKYFLVKQHKMIQENDESDLVPSFSYKLLIDDVGDQYIALDQSQMFEYYFVGEDMISTDIRLEDINSSNSHGYKEFTENDVLWVEDDELVNKLEKAEINYVETKYADIAITFRMQEKGFELIYLSRMILDKQAESSYVMIDIPLIVDTPQSLFDIQVLLICLLCKKNGMESSLLTAPSQILYIMGFNFQEDLEKIKEDIRKKPDIYDPEILKYLENVIFVTPDDVNNMYTNIKGLDDFLTKAMQETSNVEVYHAYKKLYNTLMYSELNNSMYKKSDGVVAETYMEYLEDRNLLLYTFLDQVKEDQISDYIDYIATKFSTLFPDLEYMSYLQPMDIHLVDAILRMLRAFKSYTIEIRDIDVIYRFDSRRHNLLKLMVDLQLEVSLYPIEQDMNYMDWLHLIQGTIQYKELKNKLNDMGEVIGKIYSPHELMILTDRICMESLIHLSDILKLKYGDSLRNVMVELQANDKLSLRDGIRFILDGKEYRPKQVGAPKEIQPIEE